MWLGSSQQLAKLDISHVRILSSCVKVQDTARDVDVVIDSQLSLSVHVTAVCRCGYYQLRQLRQAVRSFSEDASKTISPGVRFLPPGLLQLAVLWHLRKTDEPAAVGSERRRPSGYWQPTLRPHIAGAPSATLATGTPLRVDFKVATLVHQSLSGISLPYLADDCHLVADARERRLRSTASRTRIVTRTYSTFGDRAFGAAGPGLWNSLPSHLKDADIWYSEFRRSLKTFMFGQWGHGAV